MLLKQIFLTSRHYKKCHFNEINVLTASHYYEKIYNLNDIHLHVKTKINKILLNPKSLVYHTTRYFNKLKTNKRQDTSVHPFIFTFHFSWPKAIWKLVRVNHISNGSSTEFHTKIGQTFDRLFRSNSSNDKLEKEKSKTTQIKITSVLLQLHKIQSMYISHRWTTHILFSMHQSKLPFLM